jgi:hypothetical protein
MAITYEWSFPNFEVDGSDNVKTVHWRLVATDSEVDAEGRAYTASMYGSCNGADMTFATMTKQNAIDCVVEHGRQSEADMQVNLDNQIAALKAPATTSKTKEF